MVVIYESRQTHPVLLSWQHVPGTERRHTIIIVIVIVKTNWGKSRQDKCKGHTYTNPRPGQYLMHAHSHIIRPVEAMDSCFALVIRSINGRTCVSKTLYCRGEYMREAALLLAPAPHNTCGSCWLGTARKFSHDMRGRGWWIRTVTMICVSVIQSETN